MIKNNPKTHRELRIKQVPIDLHSKVIAHQKLLSVKEKKPDLSVDDAAIDLLQKGIESIPALN